MKKMFPFRLLASIVIVLAILQFIRLSNDHRECEERVEQKMDTAGNTVLEKQHICREKFSF